MICLSLPLVGYGVLTVTNGNYLLLPNITGLYIYWIAPCNQICLHCVFYSNTCPMMCDCSHFDYIATRVYLKTCQIV